ncbi:phage tail protein [Oscillatoria sp. FACHB-1406]|uniref:phage tail protein n=1 Tax=Oscillatoria sp. FACHB-1406 TaxID=2692846 RepID=UPI0016890B05|nr:phage tail protein [Oscillatoria sp. FACHB-1406]MBD2576477.1 phage tail protein [Oscillatoria sp. FACHB-1406]
MTSSPSRPTLDFKLSSMRPLEAVEINSRELTYNASNNLSLRPGVPAEMLVKLENSGDTPIHWKVNLKGDFSPLWCKWEKDFYQQIKAKETIYFTLVFQVPENFFEERADSKNELWKLKLDYQVEVFVETREKGLVAYQVFKLVIRPPTVYINYLPALYGEIDFVRRLISLFEQAFDPTIQTLDTLWAYLDPLTAPRAMLPFLAKYWVAFPLDPRWNIKEQRRLIRNAIKLYRWRGTRRGLLFYLRLYTGLDLEDASFDIDLDLSDLPEEKQKISIQEVSSQGFILGKASMGTDSMLGGGRPYHFIVKICYPPSFQFDEQLVREIIEREKPAFSTYELNLKVQSTNWD